MNMKIINNFEFIINHEEQIINMVKHGLIPCSMKRDIQIVKEYRNMQGKKLEIYSKLADKHGIDERTVIRIIKKYNN